MIELKNYINGVWVQSKSRYTTKIINPAIQTVLAEAPASTREDAELAIDAAKRSFYETGLWRYMAAQERSNLLRDVADELEKRKTEFAVLECKNQGKPLREAECDMDDAIYCFRYYAGLITKPPDSGIYDAHNKNFGETHIYTSYEPIGVCAQIAPWSAPLLMAARKIAPALAAGNSVIFKPASATPITTVSLFEIFHRLKLPKGCVNLVMGPGSTVGRELAQNINVDMITFTGSTMVGQSVAYSSIKNLKKTRLELGGKSPSIIFADVDLEQTVEWVLLGIFYNQGEVCFGGSRILVERSIHDLFVQILVDRANRMTIGDPLKNPDIGAIVSYAQMESVLDYIDVGKQEGATCLCGGTRCVENGGGKGFFIRPTIFDNCTSDMTIVKEEIFGPVVTIQVFDTEEEAICMANDTKYGLSGAVFTQNNARALRVIKEIQAGITWINCYNPGFNEAPWSGYKMSGQGRELGVHGLEAYQERKQVNVNLANTPLRWYKK